MQIGSNGASGARSGGCGPSDGPPHAAGLFQNDLRSMPRSNTLTCMRPCVLQFGCYALVHLLYQCKLCLACIHSRRGGNVHGVQGLSSVLGEVVSKLQSESARAALDDFSRAADGSGGDDAEAAGGGLEAGALQGIGSISAALHLHQLMSGIKNVCISAKLLCLRKMLLCCGIRPCQSVVEPPSPR
jgi:hypothetical protein